MRRRCQQCNSRRCGCPEDQTLSFLAPDGSYIPIVDGVVQLPNLEAFADPSFCQWIIENCNFKEFFTITHAAGPGTPGSAAAMAATSREWWVTDGPTGQAETWCILPAYCGTEQWHQGH